MPATSIALCDRPSATVPVASVPMRLPRTVCPEPLTKMPLAPPAIALPRICAPDPFKTMGNVVDGHGGVNSASPAAARLIRLPCTFAPTLPAGALTATPQAVRMLRAAGVEPPTTPPVTPPTTTSCPLSTRRCVPVGSVPRKLPSTRTFEPETKSTLVVHPLTASPRIVVSLAWTVKQVTTPAPPVTSIFSPVSNPCPIGSVLADAPGCVYPLTVTGEVRIGSGETSVIVWTPEPTMLNAIVSGPALALASRIAWRSVPAPASAIDVTV